MKAACVTFVFRLMMLGTKNKSIPSIRDIMFLVTDMFIE